ncbi:MAG: N-acetylmuramoyl-L-alanine amidase family protein [Xanthobacteraceae bacterium]
MTFPRRIATAALVALAALLSQPGPNSAWGEPPPASPGKPDPSRCNRAAFRVIVDVGHGVEAPGAKSARGVFEYEFNLRLAKLIEQQLLGLGYTKTILLITPEAPYRGLFKRVMRANGTGANLFLSIHHDAVPDSFLEKWEFEGQEHTFSDRFKGHSIFISYDNHDRNGSLLYARLLGKALKARGLQYTPHYTDKVMGHRRRELIDADAGVYRYDQLVVLKDTNMPAVLLEAGSIVNRAEELELATPERQSLITAAVTEAVEAFCAARSPRRPDLVAHGPRASASSKQAGRPAAAPPPANPGKP